MGFIFTRKQTMTAHIIIIVITFLLLLSWVVLVSLSNYSYYIENGEVLSENQTAWLNSHSDQQWHQVNPGHNFYVPNFGKTIDFDFGSGDVTKGIWSTSSNLYISEGDSAQTLIQINTKSPLYIWMITMVVLAVCVFIASPVLFALYRMERYSSFVVMLAWYNAATSIVTCSIVGAILYHMNKIAAVDERLFQLSSFFTGTTDASNILYINPAESGTDGSRALVYFNPFAAYNHATGKITMIPAHSACYILILVGVITSFVSLGATTSLLVVTSIRYDNKGKEKPKSELKYDVRY